MCYPCCSRYFISCMVNIYDWLRFSIIRASSMEDAFRPAFRASLVECSAKGLL